MPCFRIGLEIDSSEWFNESSLHFVNFTCVYWYVCREINLPFGFILRKKGVCLSESFFWRNWIIRIVHSSGLHGLCGWKRRVDSNLGAQCVKARLVSCDLLPDMTCEFLHETIHQQSNFQLTFPIALFCLPSF